LEGTSIVIPSFNGKHLLEECVQSIKSYTNTPFEIIVVDNGSTDGTVQYCIKQKINFISLPDNRGFPIACNLGLKIASGDTLLLLNNDVVVSHLWLSNLQNCLFSREDVGIVGPLTNFASGKQQVNAAYDNMEQFHKKSVLWNYPDPLLWQPVNRLVGFCFMFKRDLMEKIGYLDERFSPGHYEDDDYCYRARQAGYTLKIAGDVRVHHHGSASFNKQPAEKIKELIDVNHQKFIDKWGEDPLKFIE
jgi:GT2 family glycosyltransferase